MAWRNALFLKEKHHESGNSLQVPYDTSACNGVKPGNVTATVKKQILKCRRFPPRVQKLANAQLKHSSALECLAF